MISFDQSRRQGEGTHFCYVFQYFSSCFIYAGLLENHEETKNGFSALVSSEIIKDP